MKKRRYIRILFILFVLVASLAVVSENYMLGGGVKSFDIKRFSKTLHNKEKIIQDIIDKTETIIFGSKTILDVVSKFNTEISQETSSEKLIFSAEEVIANFSDKVKIDGEEVVINLKK